MSFSVSRWAKRNTTGTGDFYVLSHGSAATNAGLHVGFRNDSFHSAFWGNDLQTTGTYTDTTWTHWAATFDVATKARKVYQNGVLVGSDTSQSDDLGSGGFEIGRRFDATRYFNGGVDDVRVYTRELSAEEVGLLASGQ